MTAHFEFQEHDGEIYLAGQQVPAGRYRQIGTPREIVLSKDDVLPASLDGRVACYEIINSTWAYHQQLRLPKKHGQIS